MQEFEYLGDGLYAMFDGQNFELRANHHETPTDTVFLDLQVLTQFMRFVAAKCQGPENMKLICDLLGFDPTNHHSAQKCPYCQDDGSGG